jgi:ferritin-like metal-binding protein YciE
MPIKDSKELFVLMLSDLRQGSERTTKLLDELSQVAEDPDIKQALDARTFVSQKVVETLDQCFKLLGEQPAKLSGTRARIYEVLAEDFRKQVAEIHDTRTRRFFVLAKLNNLVHLRAAEYKTLIAAADVSGNYAVATLLETCLADKLALAERTQRWLRRLGETEMAERIATKRAA